MKRSPLRTKPEKVREWQDRSKRKARSAKNGRGQVKERSLALAFKQAFLHRPCAVCGTRWMAPDVHHVVPQRELRKRGLEHLLWDVRNGLPLCPILSCRGEDCHERHENASRRVPLSALTGANLEFAREALGPAADDYLARFYPKEAA